MRQRRRTRRSKAEQIAANTRLSAGQQPRAGSAVPRYATLAAEAGQEPHQISINRTQDNQVHLKVLRQEALAYQKEQQQHSIDYRHTQETKNLRRGFIFKKPPGPEKQVSLENTKYNIKFLTRSSHSAQRLVYTAANNACASGGDDMMMITEGGNILGFNATG